MVASRMFTEMTALSPPSPLFSQYQPDCRPLPPPLLCLFSSFHHSSHILPSFLLVSADQQTHLPHHTQIGFTNRPKLQDKMSKTSHTNCNTFPLSNYFHDAFRRISLLSSIIEFSSRLLRLRLHRVCVLRSQMDDQMAGEKKERKPLF